MIFNKLNEIQVTNRLEYKYEAIENTAKEAPKTYADIIKTTTINTKGKTIAEKRTTKTTPRPPPSRTSEI